MINSEDIKFIEYDGEKEEQELVKYAEELFQKTLYPAQYERLMLSVIEYKASLLVQKFNEAAKLNLPQCSHGLILEAIGEMAGVYKLAGSYGSDNLEIELNTTFTSDLTIAKGLEILSKDEKYTFVTTEDLIIPAGETKGVVKIVAQELGEETNNYGIGDVNILVRPISYIKSVTNVNGVTGGADEESEENFIKRILLAPESYSCAGSRQSYIYHTLSANAGIIDAQAEAPQLPAKFNVETTTETTDSEDENAEITTNTEVADYTVNESGIIDNETLYGQINYKKGEFKFHFKSDTNKVYTLIIPPQATVYIYPLTSEDVTPQGVIDDVDNHLNGESINPMTDFVQVISPTKKEKEIILNIVIDVSADYTTVSEKIKAELDKYKSEIRNKLGAEIIPSQIIARVGSIDGVYSCDCGDLETIHTPINEFYVIDFKTTITQREV